MDMKKDMDMKKVIPVVLCLFLALTMTACGGSGDTASESATVGIEAGVEENAVPLSDKPLVGIAVPEASTGWVAAVLWTAKNMADRLELNYRLMASASADDQAAQLDELVSMGCEVVVLFPHSDELAAAAQRVMDAGVTLINFDRTLGDTIPDYYVAGDNRAMGVAGGEYIIEKLGGKGDVVIVYTPSLGSIFEDRKQGFEETVRGTGIRVIGTYTPEKASVEAGRAIMAKILIENPYIDGIYSADDESSIGMLQAIREAGRTDIKVITGGGGAQSYLNLFEEYPDIWASSQTYAPYMMNTCVEMAAGLLDGVQYPARTIIPTSTVDRENYRTYFDENGVVPDAPY
jgi:ribose transport system substrate-binding protein